MSCREKINAFSTMNTISSPVETDGLNVILRGFDWFMKVSKSFCRNDFEAREVDISFIVVGTKQPF